VGRRKDVEDPDTVQDLAEEVDVVEDGQTRLEPIL
jgi:hypothetical protein